MGRPSLTRFPFLSGAALLLLCTGAAAGQAPSASSWLDRPLVNWNRAGLSMPASSGVRREETRARCQLPMGQTPGRRALEDAGWIAYDHLDRVLNQADVEIVGGMTEADAMCRPAGFQIFVLVGGALAGTLSPDLMTTAQDASAGAVRILGSDLLSAEFARYGNTDVPCCPTARMTVRYRIERSGAQPVLVPLDVRTTRSH